MLELAADSDDWRGVLKLEGRMEELLEGQEDARCNIVIHTFMTGHVFARDSTGSRDHSLSVIRLEERRVELLGKMERFRDQGEALCSIADNLFGFLGRTREATTYFTRARDLGASHGFFSAESAACLGLGGIAIFEGRRKEGLELLRNAVAAATLAEEDASLLEANALDRLIKALFQTDSIDELEPMVPRYREAVQAESRRIGRLSAAAELQSLYFSSRLHQVLCIPSHCPPHAFTEAGSICHVLHRARVTTRALLEPFTLSRNADDPKRPRVRCVLCWTSCARTRQQCKTWRDHV